MKNVIIYFLVLIATLILNQAYSQQSVADSYSPEVFSDIIDCQSLVSSGRTQSEKDELQKDYWILMGIVGDLQKYQELFITKGELINLFPAAYFHTTFAEMKRIVNGNFRYPIEKMKQMIAFYDAYKMNRDFWDKGVTSKVEIHWREHFEYAASLNELPSPLICFKLGDIITSATKAHVLYDLPRAIRYAITNRFNKNITFQQCKSILYPEFKSSDILFGKTMDYTIHDMSSAHSFCKEAILKQFTKTNFGNFIIYCGNELNVTNTLTDVDVIELRHKSWTSAFTNYPLFGPKENILASQPLINHVNLLETGKELCSSNPPQPDTNVESTFPSTIPNAQSLGQFVGGSTPEELGKLLLKALKTNDKKLWLACFSPKEAWTQEAHKVDFRGESFYNSRFKLYTDQFDYLRGKLEESGFSNFANIKFSRVKFRRVQRDEKSYVVEGESIADYFYIEFTYGTEFLGRIGDNLIITYKKGNYFIGSQGGLLETSRL